MKPPTDNEIMEMVYSQTMQETGREVEVYIEGMKNMRDIWQKVIDSPDIVSDKWIYERDGDLIYRRHFGAAHETRELLNG